MKNQLPYIDLIFYFLLAISPTFLFCQNYSPEILTASKVDIYKKIGEPELKASRKNHKAFVSTIQKLDRFLVDLGSLETVETIANYSNTTHSKANHPEHIFEIDGRKRSYYLHLPPALASNAPLVFTLHGYGGTANSMMSYSKMNEIANQYGFAVCYPQGFLGTDGKNSWNAGYSNDEINDVHFLTKLAQHLQDTYQLSAKNTFSTGMSNGADMSYVLACEAPDVFAAVAPVAGCMMESTFKNCSNENTIPIFEIHGDQDDITLWNGDKAYSEKYGGYIGTRQLIDFWKEKNQTTQTTLDTLFDFDDSDGSYIVAEKHVGGAANKQVWLYKLVGGKHDWPGTWGNKDIQTSEVVWSFFQQFLSTDAPKQTTVGKHFSSSTPEAEGISSKAISAFIKRAEEEIDAMHSFMIIRNGNKVSEGWWAPYAADAPHVMHSLSKSFTSTGIGLLVDEGKISIDNKVLSFFPEYAPEKPSWQWQQMRIRDLLTMNTGHIDEPTVWFSDGDWVKFFMETEVPLAPGTHFKYNSPATYMLSAILQKVTGEQLVDYLMPRLFEPLQIKKPHWDVCPNGINTGGWGLSITTEDIAKLGQLYLQEGAWNGQQLLSKEWATMATTKQVSNGSDPNNEWNQGYGFQFWQCRHNAFRGDGAFGQFCIVIPEKEMVVAITSGVNDMGHIMNIVWEELLPGLKNQALPGSSKYLAALNTTTNSLKMKTIQGKVTSSISKKVSKKSYILADNELGIQSIDFNLHKAPHTITLKTETTTVRIPIGKEAYLKSSLSQFLPNAENLQKKIAANGAWINDQAYQLRVYFPQMPARITYSFSFEGDGMVWKSKLEHSLFGPRNPVELVGKR